MRNKPQSCLGIGIIPKLIKLVYFLQGGEQENTLYNHNNGTNPSYGNYYQGQPYGNGHSPQGYTGNPPQGYSPQTYPGGQPQAPYAGQTSQGYPPNPQQSPQNYQGNMPMNPQSYPVIKIYIHTNAVVLLV